MHRPALIALILVSVALNAAAQIFLRAGARAGLQPVEGWMPLTVLEVLLRPGIVGGLCCYAISIVVWIYVLSRAEASFAYPFLGLGFIVVCFSAWQFLGEPLTASRLAGTLLVSAGVVVIAIN
jgi:drug/metabolite transporter (DMT)-like permease